MKVTRIVEVWDEQIQLWMMGLTRAELETFCPASWSRYAPWDVYLNWLRTCGWTMRGVIGWCGPVDEGRRVLIALEGEDTRADPQLVSPVEQTSNALLAYLDLQVELDRSFDTPADALGEALRWIRAAKKREAEPF